MSASREKKARQELNESGYVDPRKAREAEEKAKERRSTRIYTAVIVAFVLLGVVLFASGRIQASNEAKETARIGAESAVTIDGEEVIRFLRRREGILEGIAITGGEPTLWGEQLVSFIRKVKEQTDMLVKLDTNGTHPDVLRECIAAGIDYVAMDIKSSEERYHIVAGHADTRLDKVKESISILLGGEVDYEFRTTAVKPLHTAEDFNGIGQLISGAKRYFIQCYKDSGDILIESDEAAAEYERSAVGTAELGAYSKDELESFLAIAKKYIPTAELRGVD